MELHHPSSGGIRLRRFIIPSYNLDDNTVTITGDLYHHIAHVLRLKKGARILLADGNGRELVGKINHVDGHKILFTTEETLDVSPPESEMRITLLQGLPKGDKLELILQKCTELGVAEIVPFVAARSVARVQAGRVQEKLERWRRIVHEAARQSNRTTVPEISFAGDFKELLHQAKHPLKLLLWEEEQAGTLKKLLAVTPPPERIAVLVGPEGGLTSEEVSNAVNCSFISVSLGRRIVRTETAGPTILSILQFYWGDIG
jgi:16S rRNA (uracil1498-N3)-methyltransferase